MISFLIHTRAEPLWRDAARRLHRARLVADAPQAEVFDGTLLADPQKIRAALDAGRHVLVAAEPCLAREQLATLAEAAHQWGVVFAVVNPDRFLSSRQLIRQQIGTALGSPELVRSHRWENQIAAAPLGLAGPVVGEIEQAVWLVGRPVKSVFAQRADGVAGEQLHLRFEPGIALIDYCEGLPNRKPTGRATLSYRSLSVIGSRGSAQIDDQTNTQWAYLNDAGPTGLPVGEGSRHLALLLDDFTAAIEAVRDLSATLADARHVTAVVEAVKKSLASGDAVAVEAER